MDAKEAQARHDAEIDSRILAIRSRSRRLGLFGIEYGPYQENWVVTIQGQRIGPIEETERWLSRQEEEQRQRRW